LFTGFLSGFPLTALAASNLKDQPRTAALQRMRFWRAILPKREFPSLAQWIARFGRSYLRYRLKLSLPAIGQPDFRLARLAPVYGEIRFR
jgi:hypothetical protein